MTTSEKLIKIAENVEKNVEYGKSQGGGGDDVSKYMVVQDNQWVGVVFPEGYEFVLELKNAPRTLNALLYNTTGVKTATIICDIESAIVWSGVVRNSTVEVLDLTRCKLKPTDLKYFALGNTRLVSIIGKIDMTSCTAATNVFNTTTALEEIRFKEGTITIALDFHWSTKLSAESYDSIIKGHSKTASVTLTLPAEATVRSVYDAKFGSGAWDAITAQYPNVTIMYS